MISVIIIDRPIRIRIYNLFSIIIYIGNQSKGLLKVQGVDLIIYNIILSTTGTSTIIMTSIMNFQ